MTEALTYNIKEIIGIPQNVKLYNVKNLTSLFLRTQERFCLKYPLKIELFKHSHIKMLFILLIHV